MNAAALLVACGLAGAAPTYHEELVATAQMASGETVPYILDSRGASYREWARLHPKAVATFEARHGRR